MWLLDGLIKADQIFFFDLARGVEQRLREITVVGENEQLNALISNADVRKGILRYLADLTSIEIESFLNEDPTCISDSASVLGMLRLIKKSPFPIMYLPVVNNEGQAKGIVTFVNLIKGEL